MLVHFSYVSVNCEHYSQDHSLFVFSLFFLSCLSICLFGGYYCYCCFSCVCSFLFNSRYFVPKAFFVCVCTAPSLKPHTPSFPCKRLHHAMGTSERVQCVTRLNNGCEGDHGKRGTNAVYFCLKLCKQ